MVYMPPSRTPWCICPHPGHHGAYAPPPRDVPIHGAYAPIHGAYAPIHGAYAPIHGAYAPIHGAYAPIHGPFMQIALNDFI